MGKTIQNGFILHRRNPETLNRDAATGQIVNALEDQFSLAACITGIDHILQVASCEQFFENGKLRFLVLGYFQLPLIRDDREILEAPNPVLFIIGFRHGILGQMAEAPTDQAIPSGQVTVLLLICADHLGDRLRDAGFFSDNQIHNKVPPFEKQAQSLPTSRLCP